VGGWAGGGGGGANLTFLVHEDPPPTPPATTPQDPCRSALTLGPIVPHGLVMHMHTVVPYPQELKRSAPRGTRLLDGTINQPYTPLFCSAVGSIAHILTTHYDSSQTDIRQWMTGSGSSRSASLPGDQEDCQALHGLCESFSRLLTILLHLSLRLSYSALFCFQ
jgi:hypothetical protein